MITLTDYWMGRDREYRDDWTNEIQLNAEHTVSTINKLLDLVFHDTGALFSKINSGWRPPEVNDITSNASGTSKHITAQACDISDSDGRLLARWCLGNRNVLAQLGLYMEDPQWTPFWVHLQTVSPGSGRRVYQPSLDAAKTPPLSKWRRNDASWSVV